ncbi:hypothetical protein PR002_g31786 [Phytophthora rubi]|uniref:Uncharacterized protein n=1 Tax=Phytophthora rubi TaxID=129364 RepID=A0A6A3GF39_9STRA|nr:hypothetical protein PR002_g31786 [Phytophthora rubi]
MLYVLPDSAHRYKISIGTEDQLAKHWMPPPKDGGKATLRGPIWDHSEDKALANAWLVVSKDGITSTDQKGGNALLPSTTSCDLGVTSAFIVPRTLSQSAGSCYDWR